MHIWREDDGCGDNGCVGMTKATVLGMVWTASSSTAAAAAVTKEGFAMVGNGGGGSFGNLGRPTKIRT